MKINTDGVLLGALSEPPGPEERADPVARRILDIGTGTGVIALMLAQRFADAQIDAIDIDPASARRASENFHRSPFRSRLRAYQVSLSDFIPENSSAQEPVDVYDLVVSNPPFFVDSLKNPDKRKEVARHADATFFDMLLTRAARWLRPHGRLQLILPMALSAELAKKALQPYGFYSAEKTEIFSFAADEFPIRVILTLGVSSAHSLARLPSKIVIYDSPRHYSEAYRSLLKDFFLAF